MRQASEYLLDALCCGIRGRKVVWPQLSLELWEELLQQARAHHILPLTADAVSSCHMPPELKQHLRRDVLRLTMLQTMRTQSFLKLHRELSAKGLDVLSVKGILCRQLYPKPDLRGSNDEDLLVSGEEFEDLHQLLTAWGMQEEQPELDRAQESEVAYRHSEGPLYLEVHKELFAGDSEIFGSWNSFFEDAVRRKEAVEIEGEMVDTLCPTQHMLYLLLHAFKHFLHSGFGIRQVSDCILMAEQWGSQIDWQWIYRCCGQVRCRGFAAAVFAVGQKYLEFQPERACLPDCWLELKVDEGPMLEDLLEGGIYGSSQTSRQHSSNITLSAAAGKKGGTAAGLWRAIFPGRRYLQRQFRWAERHPILLPAAWVMRLIRYSRKNKGRGGESLKVGQRRVELLKLYGIID